MSSILPGIKHVVVVMFENRSFDNMLGFLYPQTPTFNALSGSGSNPTDPSDPTSKTETVWSGSGSGIYTLPNPDPGELFDDMNEQIYGSSDTSGSEKMDGFVWNYVQQPPEYPSGSSDPVDAEPQNVMHCYQPDQVPVTKALAQGYMTSDVWFASGPVQTFMNRVFAHCGTPSVGKNGQAPVNNTDYDFTPVSIFSGGPVTSVSIFEALDQSNVAPVNNLNWKVYYHDYPISYLVRYVYQQRYNYPVDNTCVVNYNRVDWPKKDSGPTFAQDCQNGTLPTYSFIEPRYSSNWNGTGTNLNPNSNHPGGSILLEANQGGPINVYYGESLLLDIYTQLYNASYGSPRGRNPNLLNETLLIVIYDEHGGCYDHVEPSTQAVSPYKGQTVPGFQYTRYGVRVPAFFINPYISSMNSQRMPKAFCPQSGTLPFDHTTIISTLIAQFGLKCNEKNYLTPRDQSAPTLEGLFDLTSPRTPTSDDPLPDPSSIQLPPAPPADAGPTRIKAFRPFEEFLANHVDEYKHLVDA
jgi:phospholipase C